MKRWFQRGSKLESTSQLLNAFAAETLRIVSNDVGEYVLRAQKYPIVPDVKVRMKWWAAISWTPEEKIMRQDGICETYLTAPDTQIDVRSGKLTCESKPTDPVRKVTLKTRPSDAGDLRSAASSSPLRFSDGQRRREEEDLQEALRRSREQFQPSPLTASGVAKNSSQRHPRALETPMPMISRADNSGYRRPDTRLSQTGGPVQTYVAQASRWPVSAHGPQHDWRGIEMVRQGYRRPQFNWPTSSGGPDSDWRGSFKSNTYEQNKARNARERHSRMIAKHLTHDMLPSKRSSPSLRSTAPSQFTMSTQRRSSAHL